MFNDLKDLHEKSMIYYLQQVQKIQYSRKSYIFEKTLVLSIICSKCNNKDENIFKEEESIEIVKIL